MRKDVRFGLAIGGSLLALLVICAALFDRGPTASTNDLQVQPAPPPGDVSQVVPQSPAPRFDVSARNNVGPSTQPVIAAGGSTTARDWSLLLNAGDSDEGAATRPAAVKAGFTEGPASRPSGVKSTAAGTHKVAPGETFSTISALVYGDSKYYSRLEEANPGVDPTRLRIGTILNVPALSEHAGASSPLPMPRPGAADTTAIDSSKSYRVRPSDTLMAIARRLYGDGQAWQKIYDANRDVIGANPARLQVGMVLRLPSPPTN